MLSEQALVDLDACQDHCCAGKSDDHRASVYTIKASRFFAKNGLILQRIHHAGYMVKIGQGARIEANN